MLRSRFVRLLAWLLGTVLFVLVAVQAVRIYDAVTGPPLGLWHTFVPAEPDPDAIDAMDWTAWLAAEEAILASVRSEVVERLEPEDEVAENRYFAGSPVNPFNFEQDWNRSFVMLPDGAPRGAAVLLHGLTDAPYSLRHVAELYRDLGFAAVAIRMPGHGTVPGGLTEAEWPDWMAATRLAVREAQRLAGVDVPLHLVGYSNGGALALKFALDALEDDALPRAARIVLMSPMIGVTRFARFAGIAGWPAIFPAFVRAAWFETMLEYNPFKYNSFPVNAARQSHVLTMALQNQIDRLARSGAIADIAPVLTFQSVVDFTVSTRAVISALYNHLPENGSELVLFDINRAAKFGPLIGAASQTIVDQLLPNPPRRFTTTIITNAGPASRKMVAVTTPAGATEQEIAPIGAVYPRDVYSLSHVAIPFPVGDGLYGSNPDPEEDFGINLGTMSARGELGVLIVSLDQFARITFNPFFPDIAARIGAVIDAPAP